MLVEAKNPQVYLPIRKAITLILGQHADVDSMRKCVFEVKINKL